MNETILRRWLKAELDGVPLTFVEPSLGSTTGAPDAWVPVKDSGGIFPDSGGLFAPVELKVAGFGRSGRIVPANVRAVQISWHERMHRAGGRTYMLFGVPGATGWLAWVMAGCSRERLMHWQKGYNQDELFQVAVDGKLDREKWWNSLRV